MLKDVFVRNRKKLFDKIEDNSAVVFFAGKAPIKSADEDYDFTPNRNFYYITGINEQDHIVLLKKIKGKESVTLFLLKPDLEREKWYAKTLRPNEATDISGIEDVSFLESFEAVINRLITSGDIQNIYLDLERNSMDDNKTPAEKFAAKVQSTYPQSVIKNVYNIMGEIRLVKSKEEVEELRKAIDITIEGVESLMKHSKPGLKEYQLEAYFDFVCKTRGAKDFAFKTIAATGKNAAVLHYSTNNTELKDGDMIQFDLGAQLNYYNADISRAFPVNGKFTKRQREVYEAVLRVNEKTIAAAKPGVNFVDWNNQATEWIAEECIKLGLIKDKSEVRKYYWHSVSHSLGLDTHDIGRRDVDFKPGMVFTVEPGIYIEEECIGIRIEDDILITEDGCEVLTKNMIKSVEDIENFMAQK